MAFLQCTKKRNRLSGKFTYTLMNAFAVNRTTGQLVLRIPAEILKVSGLRSGDRMALKQDGNAIVFIKLGRRKRHIRRAECVHD